MSINWETNEQTKTTANKTLGREVVHSSCGRRNMTKHLAKLSTTNKINNCTEGPWSSLVRQKNV